MCQVSKRLENRGTLNNEPSTPVYFPALLQELSRVRRPLQKLLSRSHNEKRTKFVFIAIPKKRSANLSLQFESRMNL